MNNQILVTSKTRDEFEREMIPLLENGYKVIHLSVAGAGQTDLRLGTKVEWQFTAILEKLNYSAAAKISPQY